MLPLANHGMLGTLRELLAAFVIQSLIEAQMVAFQRILVSRSPHNAGAHPFRKPVAPALSYLGMRVDNNNPSVAVTIDIRLHVLLAAGGKVELALPVSLSQVAVSIAAERIPVVVVPVVLAWLMVGCIETDPAELELSWTFPDGLDCAEAGVLEVEIEVSASTAAVARFACADGLAPRVVHLGAFEPGLVVVRASALAPDGVVRYVGEGRSPIDEGSQSIVLALQTPP